MNIKLIHGIHSKEGDNNMSKLLPYINMLVKPVDTVELFEYGFMGFWEARFDNDNVAMRLALSCKEDEVWITHSNGAAIAYLAVTKYGACPKGIVNVNPALDRWKTSPVEWVHTIHSKGDRAVWWSQWLPFHIWGDQGKVGYRGKNKNTTNINASTVNGLPKYKGHMGLFSNANIFHWAKYITNYIYAKRVHNSK